MPDNATPNICPTCHRSLSRTHYSQHYTDSLGYTCCSFGCAYGHTLPAPDSNTEARQLAELDAEQPEAQADTIRELMGKYDARRAAWVARFGTDTGFDAWFTGQVAPKTSPAAELLPPLGQLIDPIATLPLFSGTCPRVADPGRYDPPARRTDTQPSLF